MSTQPYDRRVAAPEATYDSGRWVILGLLLAITIINFIDRQTVSVLAPVIKQALHLSNEAYGRIVAAFQFGMMSGELPMGWIMDRWGCRIGMCAAAAWWSLATGSQAFTRSGFQLGTSRFWMGSTECGNYSGGMKAVTQSFPINERTFAVGVFNSGSVLGAAIAPPLIVLLAQCYGFRTAFFVPAGLGFIWTVLWWFFYRQRKEAPAAIAVLKIPLKKMLRQSSTWAIMLCRALIGPVIQFYWYWLPTYLFSVEHMSLSQIGDSSWIPFFLGGTGGIMGGWAAGWLLKKGVPTPRMRKITMYSSSSLCLASFAVPFVANLEISFLAMSIAIFGHYFVSANMYGAISDLFPQEEVGRATGLSGVASGLTGLLFPLLTGYLFDLHAYKTVFTIAALTPLGGTVVLFLLAGGYHTQRREQGAQ